MHIPVLYNEALMYLDPKPGENFIDCTMGDGGHSLGILKNNAPNGILLAIDWDAEAIKRVLIRISDLDLRERMVIVNDTYSNLKTIIKDKKIEKIKGILLDLGMSSFHIEKSGRGFSFQKNERLNMRYDRQSEYENFQHCPDEADGARNAKLLTAEQVVNNYGENELERIFREYGEEKFAARIAKKIIEVRRHRPIRTTKDLVGVIKTAMPAKYSHGKIHFATKIFQALRIEVNQELENLELVLPQALDVLNQNGRLVVISFHSLEDGIVKRFFQEKSNENKLRILTKKPIVPTGEEIRSNPRARSAKLRVAVKI